MKFGKILTSVAAAGLVAAPAIAQAGTKASAMPARASVAVDGKHKAAAGTVALAVLGVAAVGGGIYAAAHKHHDNKSDGAQ